MDPQPMGELARAVSFQELQRVIECPICSLTFTPPIFFCSNGHNVCSRCRPKMQNCGICRTNFLMSRNLALEALIESCNIFCAYQEFGCEAKPLGRDYQNHVAHCEFGPIICHYSDVSPVCQDVVLSTKGYVEHLIKVHGFGWNTLKLSDGQFWVEYTYADREMEYQSSVLNFDDTAFVTRTFSDLRGYIYFALTIAADRSFLNKYGVVIRLSVADKVFDCTMTMQVEHVRMKRTEIVEKGSHLTVSKWMMQKFLYDNVQDPGTQLFKVSYTLFKRET